MEYNKFDRMAPSAIVLLCGLLLLSSLPSSTAVLERCQKRGIDCSPPPSSPSPLRRPPPPSGVSVVNDFIATLREKGIYNQAIRFFNESGMLSVIRNRVSAMQFTTVFVPNDVLLSAFLTSRRLTYLRNNPVVYRKSASLHVISDRKTLSQLVSAQKPTLFFTLVQDTVPRRIRKITFKGESPPRFEIVSNTIFGPDTGFLVTSNLYSSKYLVAHAIDEVLYVDTVFNLK